MGEGDKDFVSPWYPWALPTAIESHAFSVHSVGRTNERIRRTMASLQLTQAPVAKAEMLIRKPVAEVFEAFVDPEITRRFWFTKSTGRLEAGKHIVWTWEMYDMSIEVDVKDVEPNKRIVIEWANYGSMTTVEWVFTPLENDTTYVTITNQDSREMETRWQGMRLIRKVDLPGCLRV
jgi:uncharacterized protein YndB with AHSA1/START domain